jgi:Holliday junction resolvase RusA-like endonuclease
MDIYFVVNIDPVGKGRPRFVRRGRSVHTFTPLKTRSFENALREQAFKFCPKDLIEGPINLSLYFYMPIPKSRAKDILIGCDAFPHTIKPDLDNLIKAAVDPLNGVFWKDDAQICGIMAFKYYSEKPRIQYVITYGSDNEKA